jgi:hypothetical protein
MRYVGLAAAVAGTIIFGLTYPLAWLPDIRALLFGGFLICILLVALGIWDLTQTSHSLKRNYPILANLRFVLEKIRPEIRQYFLESETDGTPFNRAKRSVVYQRAKGSSTTVRLEPSRISTGAISSGSITRLHRVQATDIIFASLSAGPIAANHIRCRCSIFPP